jgi:hypothetical protein
MLLWLLVVLINLNEASGFSLLASGKALLLSTSSLIEAFLASSQ